MPPTVSPDSQRPRGMSRAMAALLSASLGLLAWGGGGTLLSAVLLALSGQGFHVALDTIDVLLQTGLLVVVFVGSRRVFRHLRVSEPWALPDRPRASPRRVVGSVLVALSPYAVAGLVWLLTGSAAAAALIVVGSLGVVVVIGTPVYLVHWVRQMRRS